MLKVLFLDRENQPPSALGVIKVLPVASWLVKGEGKMHFHALWVTRGKSFSFHGCTFIEIVLLDYCLFPSTKD